LSDLLTGGQELVVQQSSSNSGSSTRPAAQAESEQLLASAAQLGNTKFGDEYLFGGDGASTPFAATGTDFTSTNPTGERRIEIGDGQTMAVTHDGSQVFLNTGALNSLKRLAGALAANDTAAIGAAGTLVDSAFSNV